MVFPFKLAILVLGSAMMATAQVDFPSNPMVAPKKFTTRPVGGGVSSGATIDSSRSENPNVRYVTHIVLSESRMWTSAEGKPLEAKLIAFEDLIVEAPKGAAEPNAPAPPQHPTVTRGGKVRLLVDKKPVELLLVRLSVQDREFIGRIEETLGKKAEEAK